MDTPADTPQPPTPLQNFRVDDAIFMMKLAMEKHRHAKLDWTLQSPGYGERMDRFYQKEGIRPAQPELTEALAKRIPLYGKDEEGIRKLENAERNQLEKKYSPYVMQMACNILMGQGARWVKNEEGYTWVTTTDADVSDTIDNESQLLGAISQIVAACNFVRAGGMRMKEKEWKTSGPRQDKFPADIRPSEWQARLHSAKYHITDEHLSLTNSTGAHTPESDSSEYGTKEVKALGSGTDADYDPHELPADNITGSATAVAAAYSDEHGTEVSITPFTPRNKKDDTGTHEIFVEPQDRTGTTGEAVLVVAEDELQADTVAPDDEQPDHVKHFHAPVSDRYLTTAVMRPVDYLYTHPEDENDKATLSITIPAEDGSNPLDEIRAAIKRTWPDFVDRGPSPGR